jgi:HPt (histidine-containing phosphotransfer) domain-containing protein
VKGSASTLGATALAEHAAKVETAIKPGRVSMGRSGPFRILVAVVKAIRVALPV